MLESEKWQWSHSVVSDSLNPMDCSLPGSSIHGIFQARVLEWGAIAFSVMIPRRVVCTSLLLHSITIVEVNAPTPWLWAWMCYLHWTLGCHQNWKEQILIMHLCGWFILLYFLMCYLSYVSWVEHTRASRLNPKMRDVKIYPSLSTYHHPEVNIPRLRPC